VFNSLREMPRGELYQMCKRFKKTDFAVQLQHYVKQSIQMDQAQKSPRWLERIYYTLLKRNPPFELNWLLLTDIDKLIYLFFLEDIPLCLLNYRDADKSLARPTSLCILFDGENISFDASLVIYI
jgi:hypothetical protein